MPKNLPITTLALITANAQTLRLFRTHLIAALVARGVRVLALAPNFDDDSRALVRSLGAEPVDCRLQRTGLNPVRDVLDTLHLARLLRRLRRCGAWLCRQACDLRQHGCAAGRRAAPLGYG